MIPVDVLALFFLGGSSATGTAGTTVSPPTSPTTARYGGVPGAVQVSWVAGDTAAFTRIYVPGGSSFYPYATVAPGITSFGSDLAAGQDAEFTLTHFKNGLESTGVTASWTGTGEEL